MVTIALLGALTGLGVACVLAALLPAGTDPRALLAAIDTAAQRPVRARGGPAGRVLHLARSLVAGLPQSRTRPADLAITGRDADALLLAQLTGAAVALCAPLLLATILTAAGAGVPWVTPVWVGAALAVAGWFLPERRLHATAQATRQAQRGAVTAYLDLVALRAASGAALIDALTDAAAIGTGPVYAALRRALADTRAHQVPATRALTTAGNELGLPVLTELAARLTLVEAAGAQTAKSLAAQAAAQREATLADTAGSANEATESMLIAQAVLGVGFLIFLGYPALARVATL